MTPFQTTGWVVAVIIGAVMALYLGVAQAEEGTIKAMSPWMGQGYAFPVGEDLVHMVAVYSGTMFAEDEKGSLHAASIVCPATADGNLKTMTKTVQGHCIISNIDGDRVYARFSCAGNMGNCRGPFNLEGGTGKFSGISGEGEMISQVETFAAVVVEGFIPARRQSEGIAFWPKLTYKIPEAK